MHNVPNYHHLQVHHCSMVVMVSRLVVVVIVTVVTIVVVVVVVAAAGVELSFDPAAVILVAMVEEEALVEKIEEVDDKFAWDDHLLPCLLRQH